VRHKLEKTDPSAAVSTVKEPIVYYVDRGAPEPVRSALIEGASWWASAFEKAGFKDAYRVELLPEGVDAQDIRYNVITWCTAPRAAGPTGMRWPIRAPARSCAAPSRWDRSACGRTS
jgi:hypothetical protein